MKIAVSAVDADVSSKVDSRFGWAKYFMVFDTDSQKWSVLDNSARTESSGGGGIQTAQMIAREGISAVITGHCGPNAWQALSSANIKVYFVGSKTVSEAIAEFLNGNLKPSDGADVQGHWKA